MMQRFKLLAPAFLCTVALMIGFTAFAQQTQPRVIPEDNRPPLFLRETWKVPPAGVLEVPVTPDYLTNPNLEVKMYGPGNREVVIVHHDTPRDEPSYIWTGLVASGNWVVMLRDKNNYVDLSGPVAKIRWRTKQAGFHLLRPVLKLADGTFLVGDYTESYTVDWRETEFPLANVRWRGLDGVTAVETTDGRWKDNVDLSKVDEIGFTDLALGSGRGTGGATRVDWIEVYGNPVKRDGSSN